MTWQHLPAWLVVDVDVPLRTAPLIRAACLRCKGFLTTSVPVTAPALAAWLDYAASLHAYCPGPGEAIAVEPELPGLEELRAARREGMLEAAGIAENMATYRGSEIAKALRNSAEGDPTAGSA